jgi:hypothetical protein
MSDNERVCRACHMSLWVVPHRDGCEIAALEAENRELRAALERYRERTP